MFFLPSFPINFNCSWLNWVTVFKFFASSLGSSCLYKYNDPRDLAKNLNTVIQLNQEELKLMGNEGRKNVTKKFDVEIMCDSNLREYKKLLKN